MAVASIVLFSVLTAGDAYVTGPVKSVAEGFKFTEGPLWLPSNELIFSDIPADTIYKIDKTVFRKPSGESNGLAMDGEGRLIACEHGNRRVSRTEKDGAITVLAETYGGKKLNSPNDAVVRSDGTIFFTDPPYGVSEDKRELAFQAVFAVLKDGTLKMLGDDFVKPNGIGLSPDEKTLYVADTEGKNIRAFDIAPDVSLTNGRVFCELPEPDGMAIDTKGFVWCTAGDGVRVYSPDGKLVHTVVTPQAPANCCFGDPDRMTLYITARTAVYSVRVVTPGLRIGPK
ncbi:MAG: SMP-30/gluconolactonase/LRE family protein [Candidatus Hydrogenedentes bacterium]|nr:SMP-30/gluconolactonase/LRE family protein [Candidatus Hydrogenedentota bacterium]